MNDEEKTMLIETHTTVLDMKKTLDKMNGSIVSQVQAFNDCRNSHDKIITKIETRVDNNEKDISNRAHIRALEDIKKTVDEKPGLGKIILSMLAIMVPIIGLMSAILIELAKKGTP
jgi:hypothetical protein